MENFEKNTKNSEISKVLDKFATNLAGANINASQFRELAVSELKKNGFSDSDLEEYEKNVKRIA